MSKISFDQALGQPFALLDLGSAVEFLENRSVSWMTGGDSDWHSLAREWNEYPRPTRSHLWSKYISKVHDRPWGKGLRLLEQFIVHDKLLLDEAVYDHDFRDIAKVWRLEDFAGTEIFSPLEIPPTVRCSIKEEVGNASHLLYDLEEFASDFYSYDKLAHDGLHASDYMLASFANSNDSAHRAFYYLELSRALAAPLVITSAKEHYLRRLKGRTIRFIHDYLSDRALKATNCYDFMDGAIESREVDSVELPPLQEMILRKSLEEDKSPILVASEIKASEPAKAYRQKIHDLWVLRNGDITVRRQVRQQINDLVERVAALAGDPEEGIAFRSRQLNLDWIPLLGPLLKALGSEMVTIKDPMLTSASKVDIFLASWFK